MSWIKRRLRNWINSDDLISEREIASGRLASGHHTSSDHVLGTDPLHINIYRANGGTVVESRQYDRVKDRSQNQLYIVAHDANLGESLAKIIMMESLRG
jgi:hypothetical protein